MTREVRLTPDFNQFLIVTAETASQLDVVRKLLLEYWRSRDLRLSVFNFDRELEDFRESMLRRQADCC